MLCLCRHSCSHRKALQARQTVTLVKSKHGVVQHFCKTVRAEPRDRRFNTFLTTKIYLRYLPSIKEIYLRCLPCTKEIYLRYLPCTKGIYLRYLPCIKEIYLRYLPCIEKFGLPPSASCLVNRKVNDEKRLPSKGSKGMYISVLRFSMTFTLTKYLENSSSFY